MSVGRYLLRRLLQAIPLLIGVIIINFLLLHAAPGEPTDYLIGQSSVEQAFVDRLKVELGLDKPLHVQLWRFFLKAASGDLGYSFASGAPVLHLILERFPATLLLMGSQYILSAFFGILLGVLSSRKPNSFLDNSVTVFSLAGYAIPIFWLGQMFILILGYRFECFPLQGMVNLRQMYSGFAYVLDVAYHLALPVLTLTLFNMSLIVRLTRGSMLQVLGQEYIRVARSKGLSERTVLMKHALRNALLPVVTVIGLNFRTLIAGAVLTETVFAWPGLGRLTFDAIHARDYPLLMGMLVFTCILVIIGNLLTDLIYSLIDPRIRYG
jgi:peptide/nickel transport system permease protein